MFVFTALALTSLLRIAVASHCRPGFDDTSSGACAKVISESIHRTWVQAREFCQDTYADVEADLVTFESPEEEQTVVPIDSRWNYWIGLSDTQEENKYVWVNGLEANYTNWGTGQPSEMNATDCVAVGAFNGNWSEVFCNTALPFICGYTPEVNKASNGEFTTANETATVTGKNETASNEGATVENKTITETGKNETVSNEEVAEVDDDVSGSGNNNTEYYILNGTTPTTGNNETVSNEEDNFMNGTIPTTENNETVSNDGDEAENETTTTTTAAPTSGCSGKWKMMEGVGCVLILDDKKLTWAEARKECKNDSKGDLLVVPDKKTHKHVKEFFENGVDIKPKVRYWFGLNQREAGEEYIWLDNYSKDTNFNRWCRQNGADQEWDPNLRYCGMIASGKRARWNSGICDTASHYAICTTNAVIQSLFPGGPDIPDR